MSNLTGQAIAYIQAIVCTSAGGHGVKYTMRVYRNTISSVLRGLEQGCDVEIAALAALLRDADDHKLFATENNPNARRFLKCEVINSMYYSSKQQKCALMNMSELEEFDQYFRDFR